MSKEIKRQLNKDRFTTGLYIQYGIVKGYDAKGEVQLSYFDTEPLEPRYYMFGSFDAKVSVFDITVDDMKPEEEIRLRCFSKNSQFFSNDPRCAKLCHFTCAGKLKEKTKCKSFLILYL